MLVQQVLSGTAGTADWSVLGSGSSPSSPWMSFSKLKWLPLAFLYHGIKNHNAYRKEFVFQMLLGAPCFSLPKFLVVLPFPATEHRWGEVGWGWEWR